MSETEKEWRQELEPTLTEQLWLPWKIGETNALVKKLFTSTSYNIAVFDFNEVWIENCEREIFAEKVKKLNPNVEAPSATLLQHIQDTLASTCQDSAKLKMEYLEKDEESDKELLMVYWSSQLLGGVPFTWEFELTKASSQQVCRHLINPLLTMVGEMSRRESELMELLSKKDAEIEDYKMAGGKVSRKYLQTTCFNEDIFRQKMNTSKAFEKHVATHGLSAFVGSAGNLYKEVQLKDMWRNINQEDAMPEMDGSSASGTPMSSPTKSMTPHMSPVKNSSPDGSPAKDTELLRRQALERKLNEERSKLESKKKKKKLF